MPLLTALSLFRVRIGHSQQFYGAWVRKTNHVIQVEDFGSWGYRLTWRLNSTMWASFTQSCLCKEALVNPLNTTLQWASTVGTTLCILSHIVARRRYGSMGRGWPAALLEPLPDSALFVCFLGLFYSILLPMQYIIIMSMTSLRSSGELSKLMMVSGLPLPQHLQLMSEVRAVLKGLLPQLLQFG